MADVTSRYANWMLRLAEFNFEIIHRAGIKNQAADALSWLTENGLDRISHEDDIPFMAFIRSNKHAFNSPTIDGEYSTHADMNLTFEKDLPTVLDFNESQRVNIYCREASQYLGLPNAALMYDKNGALVRKAPNHAAIRKVVTTSLRTRILHLAQ